MDNVPEYLQALASEVPKLPDAGLLWWRARAEKRRRDLSEVLRPLAWAERFAYVAAGIIAVFVSLKF